MSAIAELLARRRAQIRRVTPAEAHALHRGGGLLVDTRPADYREREGHIPGSLIVERNVLEWRLDPTSPDRLPELQGTGQEVVVLCNEGYASTLAVAQLTDLGLTRVADLIGGYRAWRAAGLPTV